MLSDWLREALEHANISQSELARRLTERLGRSIDRAAVNKMLLSAPTARAKPRKISADEMLAIEEITGYPAPVDQATQTVSVPLVSWVSAGRMWAQDAVMTGDVVRRVSIADLPPGDWIGLQLEGDSMDRIAPPGSIIIVNRNDTRLLPGKFYVFGYDDGQATFKRFRADPDRLQPFSTNPDHETIYPENGLKVIGRARRVITELE